VRSRPLAASAVSTAPVVDAGPAADPPWMVTAYIPGPSLNEVVRTQATTISARAVLTM
jgi:hypothetical protein